MIISTLRIKFVKLAFHQDFLRTIVSNAEVKMVQMTRPNASNVKVGIFLILPPQSV